MKIPQAEPKNIVKQGRFMRQIPDCTHPSGTSMVLFSFHQNEKTIFAHTQKNKWHQNGVYMG